MCVTLMILLDGNRSLPKNSNRGKIIRIDIR
jgi:hypothetical protein